jgi:hypothetical protein
VARYIRSNEDAEAAEAAVTVADASGCSQVSAMRRVNMTPGWSSW